MDTHTLSCARNSSSDTSINETRHRTTSVATSDGEFLAILTNVGTILWRRLYSRQIFEADRSRRIRPKTWIWAMSWCWNALVCCIACGLHSADHDFYKEGLAG